MVFRMGRTSIRLKLDDRSRDDTYYQEKGWFESGYFYPMRFGAGKKLAGRPFDSIQTRTTRKRKATQLTFSPGGDILWRTSVGAVQQ